ncbi:hypothetical protein TVAG_177590 [Trichomonas vaginalis G3]|uniref:Uncharacterized protein n=1 Tax=Trichomonas vaginalis (strain ATCC PRA-98 / G3) TaxID=412133 RepID=A2G8D8_TRIV3|nr:hypothetical protein TVAGG3_0017360 [Trichomonas vaginalis G3]EAX86582.1 hypothetical protein TVAG_177590 [Trichomonas vaginalis G3]KAI5539460.1 hypothetical protein TVAGG3_0017360 [Trichomonas vaginalis G3]|eukprot:XP_001299512.1 hypothetical protein [Trichomonas vaginalis G3]
MSLIIGQPSPCFQKENSGVLASTPCFPSPKFASFNLACLYIVSLASVSKSVFAPIFASLNFIAGIHFVISGDLSVGQVVGTFCMSYIAHFYSQRIPFWFLHVENIIFPILYTIIFIVEKDIFFHDTIALGRAITTLSLWIADCYMLGRYHFTRAGFVSVGRPIDLEYEADSKSNAYFSILSSEEEEVFTLNLKKDLIDSFVATFLYLIGLVVRYAVIAKYEASSNDLI